MRKQKSEFSILPEEELDLKHQGSIGGQQIVDKNRRTIEKGISSLRHRSESSTPGREPVEGPDVAMTSPSHERREQATPERAPAEGPEQAKSSKKHHYK